MREIPKDIIDDVNKVVNKLLTYKNDNNLSWIRAYKDVLSKLNMDNKKEDITLLTNVVTKITRLGYDIMDNPFKLERFM
jgi:hypothetical protein